MTRLILLGAGGHARVLVDALSLTGRSVTGYVAPSAERTHPGLAALHHLGGDEALDGMRPDAVVLVNGIGSTGNIGPRRQAFERARALGFRFETVIHPHAVVAADVVLGEGAQIMAGVVLQPGVEIGANAIVNTGAVLDHDARIGDHVHVAPRACLAGAVVVEPLCHVGAGATVIQNIRIGAAAIVGAGAVVVHNVPTATMVIGCPARPKSKA